MSRPTERACSMRGGRLGRCSQPNRGGLTREECSRAGQLLAECSSRIAHAPTAADVEEAIRGAQMTLDFLRSRIE